MGKIKSQLVVVGGGPAGVCSALAAARRGIDTVLVSNRPVLGGNSSSEIRVWTRGAVGAGNFYGEEMGIWGELKLTNLYRNPDGNPVFWDEVLLDAVLKEQKLTLLLNTDVFNLSMVDNKIHSVFAEQQGTETCFELEADVFIDATGDGLLGALTELPYYIGEDYISSREQAISDDHKLLCCSIMFYTKEEDHPVSFVPPDYAYDIDHIAKLVDCGGRIVNEKMGGSDCWWFEYGGNMDVIKNLQEITLELKRLVMGVWNYIKNSGKFNAENYTLEWIGNISGKRESRRIETDYMLTEQDILSGKHFSDGVFYGGWYMDTHPSGGMHDTEEENCIQIPVNVYQIPLRCLYNAKVPNLIFAGRNIGTERQAFVSSRVMNTCALSGQAAGELAAAVIQHKSSPADMKQDIIDDIRLKLIRNDMFIPGAWIEDACDIGKEATVRSSSFDTGISQKTEGSFDLKQGGFISFPGVENEHIYLEVTAQRDSEVNGKWYLSNLPNRLRLGEFVGDGKWTVPAGKSVMKLKLPQGSGGKFCSLEFEATEDISLLLNEGKREGFLCGRKEDPVYFDPMLYYLEDMGFYRPERVVESPDRPWGSPNQWRAAEGDLYPWLELHWSKERTISQMVLFLDPSLNEELPSSRAKYWQEGHLFVPRHSMPAHLIRSAKIQIPDERGGWKTIAQFNKNYGRLVKLRLADQVKTSVLRLVIDETWGGTPAVYGLRIYEKPV